MVNVSELPSCQFISFSTWNVETSHVVTVRSEVIQKHSVISDVFSKGHVTLSD